MDHQQPRRLATLSAIAAIVAAVFTTLAFFDNSPVRIIGSDDPEDANLSLEDPQPADLRNVWTDAQMIPVEDNVDLLLFTRIRVTGSVDWHRAVRAQPGAQLEVLIGVKNPNNAVIHNLIVGLRLTDRLEYQSGQTTLYNSSHPEGTPVSSDNIGSGGINVDHYAHDAAAYVIADVHVSDDVHFSCGHEQLTATGMARPDKAAATASTSAIVDVRRDC